MSPLPPSVSIPALTLWQPWATMCVTPAACDCDTPVAEAVTRARVAHALACSARGTIKTIETRSWPAPPKAIGQRIAIHAAKRQPDHVDVGPFEAYPDDPRNEPHPNHPDGRPARMYRNDRGWLGAARWSVLPLGAVVGTAVLAGCIPMVDRLPQTVNDLPCLVVGDWTDRLLMWRAGDRTPTDVTDQRPYGLFEAGRWAWLLADAVRFDDPIPATGRQGLWWWAP